MQAPASIHPSDQTLRAFGNGQLDADAAEAVSTHLDECDECLQKVAGISSDGFLEALRKARSRRDPEPRGSGMDRDQPRAATRPSLPSTEAKTLPPGAEIPTELANHPDYRILRELGRGGMGVVYLAQNKLMGRPEVLKVVSGHLVNRPGVLDRFLAEIRSAAQLEHTNVVTAYSALRLGESVVLAMQYVEGLDLARLVDSRGPLPVPHACNYAHQAALGLQHAHERGMVHRDIKPSNLMLTRQGNRAVIKVLDFGLAKVRSEGPTDGTLTHEGQLLGTPDFIAPEQIRNARGADIRADIYSLGCTFYYLLTGGPPFQGASLYDILQAHHSVDAKPLNLARPDVPVELAALVAKMMAKEPERRFQEPKGVAQALIPFFKKGVAPFKSPGAEFSQVAETGSGRTVQGVVSPPTQPATNDEGPVVRPKQGAEPTAPETEWRSLIDLGETQHSRVETRAAAPRRQPPWLWPAVAVGVLLLGLLVACGVVLWIRTSNGTIELANLPSDAKVFVDGGEVTVTWPGGGKPAVITVAPGTHKIIVKKDGIETAGDEVTVQAAGKEKFTVRFERPLEQIQERFEGRRPARFAAFNAERVEQTDPGSSGEGPSIGRKLDRDEAHVDPGR